MPGCSAVNCTNRSEKGYRLFLFPRNVVRRAQWLQNTRRGNWIPTDTSRLCEIHFEDSQFENHRADGLKKLKPNAIPTLFDIPSPSPTINLAPRKSLYKALVGNSEIFQLNEPTPNESSPIPVCSEFQRKQTRPQLKAATMLKRSAEYDRRAAIVEAIRAGRSAAEIVQFFKYSRSTVYDVVAKYRAAREADEDAGLPARKQHCRVRRARTPATLERAEALIAENPGRTLRSLAETIGVSEPTMRRIVKDLRYRSCTFKEMEAYSFPSEVTHIKEEIVEEGENMQFEELNHQEEALDDVIVSTLPAINDGIKQERDEFDEEFEEQEALGEIIVSSLPVIEDDIKQGGDEVDRVRRRRGNTTGSRACQLCG